MPVTVGTSGGNKTLTEMHVGTSGGNKQVTEAWVGTASGNKLVYAAGGTDVTPSAVNWANIGPTSSPGSNANQTISGIDTTISISASLSGPGNLFYDLSGAGFVAYTAPFGVTNGQTLRWQVTSDLGNVTGTATITNDSDGSATLDTFAYDVTA